MIATRSRCLPNPMRPSTFVCRLAAQVPVTLLGGVRGSLVGARFMGRDGVRGARSQVQGRNARTKFGESGLNVNRMNFAKSARIRVKDQWSEIRGFGAALHNHRRKSVIFAKVLPRSPLEIRYSVAVEPSFPLTLTLSPGEREQPPPGACCAPTGLANSVAGMTPRGGGRFSLSPGERGRVRGEKMQPFQCSMF